MSQMTLKSSSPSIPPAKNMPPPPTKNMPAPPTKCQQNKTSLYVKEDEDGEFDFFLKFKQNDVINKFVIFLQVSYRM